jgi:hypothetical protein
MSYTTDRPKQVFRINELNSDTVCDRIGFQHIAIADLRHQRDIQVVSLP